MATSNAHKWGQVVGELFERAVSELLATIAREHGLYLDKNGFRPARRGKRVRWRDVNGNEHNLDYVMERGGSDSEIGTPVAFIETAWRRYTKHSKNKVQEIEGALIPLSRAYRDSRPLLGVILAGEFTLPSLEQLRSQQIHVLHIPYASILKAFRTVGIDASSSEQTSEDAFATKIAEWEQLSAHQIEQIKAALIQQENEEVVTFSRAVSMALSRTISSVAITTLYGDERSWKSVETAIEFVRNYALIPSETSMFMRFEISIRYSNGDNIVGEFRSKADALGFLESFLR